LFSQIELEFLNRIIICAIVYSECPDQLIEKQKRSIKTNMDWEWLSDCPAIQGFVS